MGESFSVGVMHLGLPAGTRLEQLAVTLSFPLAAFGTPITITPGSIVPNPLASDLDFLTIADPVLADISFQTNSLLAVHHITSDGVYATVNLTAEAVSTGHISISFIDGFAFKAAGPNQPLAITIEDVPGLTFSVNIPEPSVRLSAIVGLAMLARRQRADGV